MNATELDFSRMRKGTHVGGTKRIEVCAQCKRKGIAVRRTSEKDVHPRPVFVSVYHAVKLVGPRTRLGIAITDRCTWVEGGAR